MKEHSNPYWLILEDNDVIRDGDWVTALPAAGLTHAPPALPGEVSPGGWIHIPDTDNTGRAAKAHPGFLFARLDKRSLEILTIENHKEAIVDSSWEFLNYGAVDRQWPQDVHKRTGNKGAWKPYKEVAPYVEIGKAVSQHSEIQHHVAEGWVRRRIPGFLRHAHSNANTCPVCPKIPQD